MELFYFLCLLLLSLEPVTGLDPILVSRDPLKNERAIHGKTNHQSPFTKSGGRNLCKFITTWAFTYGTSKTDLECQVADSVPTNKLNQVFEFLNHRDYNLTQYPVIISDDCGNNCEYFANHRDKFMVKTSVSFLKEAQIFRVDMRFVHTTGQLTIYNRPIYILSDKKDLNGLSNHSCNRELLPKEGETDELNKQNECYIELSESPGTGNFLRDVAPEFFSRTGLKPFF